MQHGCGELPAMDSPTENVKKAGRTDSRIIADKKSERLTNCMIQYHFRCSFISSKFVCNDVPTTQPHT